MSEPGWYPDYEDEARLRYHDGTAWTDHVHIAAVQDTLVQDPPVRQVDALQPESGDGEVVAPPFAKPDSLAVRVFSQAVIGLFLGLLFGGFLFNGIGAITPVTETTGTVTSIDIEYSRGASSNTRTTKSYVLSGTTAAGESWTMYNEDAYMVLQREGYPQAVAMAIGNWTGTPERVTGESFEVNHQSTGARVSWGAVIAFLGLIGIGGAVLISRLPSGGPIPALVFLVFFFGVGNWLGWQAFQWFQSS